MEVKRYISKKMAAIWLLLLSLLPFVFLFHLYKAKKTGRRKPPGPSGLPLIGNLHQFDSANPHESLRKLSQKYGPLMSLRFGSITVIVISSAKTAKQALKTNDLAFSGRPSLVAFRKLSYNGLDVGLAPYGESWKQMKKISVVHLFSSKKVQQFRPIIQDEVSLLVAKISYHSDSHHGQGINLSSLVSKLTSGIISRIAFGKKYGEDVCEAKKMGDMLKESSAMFVGFFFADYFPLLGWIDKLTGMSSRLEKSFRDLDSFYQQLIDDHLNPERPDTMNGDVLDTLIQMKDDQSLPFDLSWDHIKATLMDIFVAGSDTSAALIIWVITSLIKNPSVMERVQTEIRDLVRSQGTWEKLLEELPYFNAVIKETFRLYPPSPMLLPRETIRNCILDGFDISDKTRVIINAWAIARDPKIWENPKDFLPDRFLKRNFDLKANDFEIIPFGSGRRGCPGINVGLLIVRISLANILYSFNWKVPDGMKIKDIDTDANLRLTMHKKNPLCLIAMENH